MAEMTPKDNTTPRPLEDDNPRKWIPWQLNRLKPHIVLDKDACDVATFSCEEDAKMAVHAVNNHDPLIEALDGLLASAPRCTCIDAYKARGISAPDCVRCNDWDDEAESQARSTLLAAKGGV